MKTDTSTGTTIDAAQLKEIIACLEDGRMQWIMWAHSWQRDRAYGNGRPEIHPTHAGVIARFDKTLADLDHPPFQDSRSFDSVEDLVTEIAETKQQVAEFLQRKLRTTEKHLMTALKERDLLERERDELLAGMQIIAREGGDVGHIASQFLPENEPSPSVDATE